MPSAGALAHARIAPLDWLCADERPMANGPIEVKTPEEVQVAHYVLPSSFKWVDCDVGDVKEASGPW